VGPDKIAAPDIVVATGIAARRDIAPAAAAAEIRRSEHRPAVEAANR
jgi:hypothetical protein